MNSIEVYCDEWLPPFHEDITPDVLKRRNYALTWQFYQVCASFAGFACFVLTKVFFHILIDKNLYYTL